MRELPPLRLSIEVETPSGRRYAWNESDPRPENVPNGLRFASNIPGGFDSFGCTLPRKPGVDYRDLERLTTIRVKGAGGEIAWEGRLERAPRTSGNEFAVSPDAQGWQTHLADDSSVRIAYVDRDLGRWQEPSRQRRLDLLTAGWDRVEAGGSEPDATTGLPGMKLTIQGAQTDTSFTAVEAWYDGFDEVADIYYDYVVTGGVAGSLFLQVGVATDDVGSSQVSSGDLYGTASGSGYFTPATAERWAFLQLLNTATWTDETERTAQIRRISVWGNHGLTKRGSAPDQGLWASDVIAHAVGRWAPLLSITDDSVQDSGFVIQQLAFTDPTTVAEVITQANRFHLNDWAVWEGRTFWYYPRGSVGKSWRARINPAQLEETGPQIDRLFSDVIVTYQDVDGTARTVGYPGSGADSEDDVLHDDDPENPANKLGITRSTLLAISTATLAEATEVGRRFLVEAKLLDTSGSAKLVGHVEDDRGVLFPAWKVRAGDTISFVDASDKSARRITSAAYDHESRTTDISLDSPPEGMAALIERLGAAAGLLGLS